MRYQPGTTEWTHEEEYKLATLYSYYGSAKTKWTIIGKEMGKKPEACRGHWRLHGYRIKSRIRESPYPKYDSPLEMDGNALVLPDPEFPFHDSEFINRVLDLSQSWKIDQCIIGGDMLHFASLSNWNPAWETPNGHGGLDENQEAAFVEFAKSLSKRNQEAAFDLLDKIGGKCEDGDPNVSEELSVARKSVKSLAECFKKVDVVLGNHEGRLLRELKSPLFPTEITRLIDMQDWRIAPYYYQLLNSSGELFRIVHPRSASKTAAETLASKFQCHILMGHSHALRMNFDISGRYYAYQIGHCCDELRFPYAGQRDSTTPVHLHGAVIVRDGYPWMLHNKIDWKRMDMMA
jgi:hypothetical protein